MEVLLTNIAKYHKLNFFKKSSIFFDESVRNEVVYVLSNIGRTGRDLLFQKRK